MDIDIAFWIVVAVAVTGSIYVFDLIALKPKRQVSVANYKREAVEVDDEVIAELEKEPVWVEYPKSFFPVLLLVLVFRSFLVEPFTIPSGSMMPTLIAGDYILVNKFAYGLRLPVIGTKFVSMDDPKRGDVMVFKYPEDPKINYIKRVVGLPGDLIEYKDKRLWVNGSPVEREEISRLSRQARSEFLETVGDVEFKTWVYHNRVLPSGLLRTEWTVPEGHYFVLGDNRDNSKDSRFWGFVPDELVVGKAFAIWMHLSNSILPSFSRNGVII